MLPTLCSLAALLMLVVSAPASEPFSLRMLYSIIARQQGIISSGASTSTLESGVLAQALQDAVEQYPSQSPTLTPYLDRVLAVITPNLTNATADVGLSLDRFSIATALLEKQQSSELTSTEDDALTALTASFALQRRNPAGGLWYYVYPQWSYLDGIHSILPFMALQPYPNFTDINLQINLLTKHCTHPSGLLVHGYDYSKTAVWADPVTGGSPYVWGRSLGWFMGGLVEGWEILCVSDKHNNKNDDQPRHQACSVIQQTFTALLPPLVFLADPDTGAWYQLPTLPDNQKQGDNFLESSSTVLFVWSILKAVRLGMLLSPSPSTYTYHNSNTTTASTTTPRSDAATAIAAALKAYHYTTSTFVTYTTSSEDPDDDQTDTTTIIGFNGTVAVNSLNSTADYTYYTSRPLVVDSLLGESAFVLASLEVEMLQTGMWWSGGTVLR